MKQKSNLKMIGAVALVLAAAFALAWGVISRGTRLEPIDLSGVEITPQLGSALAMEPQSGFLISGGSLSQKELEENLSISPGISYTLSPTDGGYLVLPSQPLEEDTLYNLTLGDSRVQLPRTWAFQTVRPVGIRSSYPSHGTTYFPVDGGLEFSLSHTDLDISEHFSIDPPVEGSWEKHNSTQVFLPSQPLESDTLYTVTISPGATCSAGKMEEETVIRFRTTDRDVKNQWEFSFIQNRLSETFLPGDPVMLEFDAYYSGDYLRELGQAQVSIYRLKDGQEYLSLLEKQINQSEEQLTDLYEYVEDMSGREPSLRFSPMLHKTSRSSYLCSLPDNASLDQGWYLAQITVQDDGRDYTIQKFLQISSTSLYLQSQGSQVMAWVNSAQTGQPMTGVRVEVADNASFTGSYYGETGQDGVALFDGYGTQRGYLRITQNGQVLYTELFRPSSWSDEEDGPTQVPLEHRYFSMLYTDRTLYQPTDTIRAWGFLSPRQGETLPSQVTVRLQSWQEDSPVLAEQTVSVGKDGSFEAALSLEDVVSSGYNVFVTDAAGERYTSTFVSVRSYRKPSCLLSHETDRKWYGPGDSARLTLTSTFYDGTPVPGMAFEVTGMGLDNGLPLVTDSQGRAAASFTLPLCSWEEEPNACEPFTAYYTAHSADAQNKELVTFFNITVLPRSVILDAQLETAEDGSRQVVVTTNRTDPSILEKDDAPDYCTADDVKGETVDLPVTMTVMAVDVIAQQTGEEYDFLTGKVVPIYEYTTRESVAARQNLRTQDGKLVVKDLSQWESTADRYYYLVFSCTDLDNRPVETDLYLGKIYPDLKSSLNHYTLSADSEAAANYRYQNAITLDRGESASLSFYNNGAPAQNQGRILWAGSQDRIFQPQITDQSSVTLTLDDASLPNLSYYGAYFDGQRVYRVVMPNLRLNNDSARGMVEITSDKESYSPGDKASLEIRVTGPDGSPMANAAYVISVADEAVFTLSPQDYDAADDLFTALYYDEPVIQLSYVQYDALEGSNDDATGGMGGGGGDGENVRKFFPDTAVFACGQTDKDGRASVSLTLPDSLTSWRITSAAVDSQALNAASSRKNITVSVPFFLDPLYSQQYVEGDDVSFTARVFTQEGTDPGTVNYTVTVKGAGTETTQTASGGTQQAFSFGPLPQGEYTVLMKAEAGQQTDSLELPFTVVESALSLPAQQVLDLSQPVSLDALRYPVTVTFTDARYGTYNQVAAYLAAGTGVRADQQIAAHYARSILGMEGAQLPDISDFTHYDGGLTLLPNREQSDLLLTARAAAAAPKMVADDQTILYLRSWLSSAETTPDEAAAIYMALAAMGEPVLDDLYQLITLPDLTDTQRICLTAALGFAGDDAKAKEAYDQFVAPLLTRANGQVYLEDERGRAFTFEKSAAALMAASACRQKEDADGLALYLLDNPSAYTTASLELLSYLRRFQPTQDTTARFSYTGSDGKKVTVDLSETPAHSVQFTKEGLEKAGFKVLSGDVRAVATYQSPALTQDTQLMDGISITKTVENFQGGEIRPGTLLTVTLDIHFDPNAPTGTYQIRDAVPSGARFVGMSQLSDIFALDGEEQQALSFTLWHAKPSDRYNLEEVRRQLELQMKRTTPYEGDIILDRCGLTTDQAVALLAEEEGVSQEEIRARYNLNDQGPGLRTAAFQWETMVDNQSSWDEVPVDDGGTSNPSTSGADESSFYDYKIVYQMRAATSGSYVLESAFLMDPAAGTAAASPRSTLVIQP